MGLSLGKLTGSISSVAQKGLGGISQVRTLMNFNPLASGLVFPPQVSLGLKGAGLIGKALGIKVPNEQEIIGMATGKIDKLLGGIRGKVGTTLDKLEGYLKLPPSKIQELIPGSIKGKNKEQILDAIDWLLTVMFVVGVSGGITFN